MTFYNKIKPAYYNDFDAKTCDWLEELIRRDLIAPGDVDRRSILEVKASDLRSYVQAHFFAGIGGWSYALRLAGWPDDRPVWTGSPPCFPAGTLVMCESGQIPIESVTVGTKVLTHKGRWRTVTHTGSASDKPLVKVVGQGHTGLVCTSNHPFMTGEDEWTEAKDLKGKRWRTVADVPSASIPQIGTPKGVSFVAGRWRAVGSKDNRSVYLGRYESYEAALDARRTAIANGRICVQGSDAVDPESLEFARFLGFWVGNGWASSDDVCVCDDLADEPLVREIVNEANLSGSASYERTSFRFSTGSLALAKWLKEHFGSGAYSKRIPMWLHGASAEYRASFLRGYMEADGTSRSSKATASTTSWELALGLRILFNQCGKSVSMRKVSNDRVCVIEGRVVNERPYYKLDITDTPRSFFFTQIHGVGLVRKVEPVGRGVIYNLAVEDDNTYVADGIVVHNCQPFSAAGLQKGQDDERHLAPHFAELIAEGRPDVLFGEQVASAAVFGKAAKRTGVSVEGTASLEWAWLDDLFERLEAAHYACGATDIPSAGIGAPHIRQRTFFGAVRMADADGSGQSGQGFLGRSCDSETCEDWQVDRTVDVGRRGRLDNTASPRHLGQIGGTETDTRDEAWLRLLGEGCGHSGVADTNGRNTGAEGIQRGGEYGQQPEDGGTGGLADADCWERHGVASGQGCQCDREAGGWVEGDSGVATSGGFGGLADALCTGRPEWRPVAGDGSVAGSRGGLCGLADADGRHSRTEGLQRQRLDRLQQENGGFGLGPLAPTGGLRDADDCGRPRPIDSPWTTADWLFCRDGKWRPTQSSIFPLAHGIPARVGRLRGYGNAINPWAAKEFIEAFIEANRDLAAAPMASDTLENILG